MNLVDGKALAQQIAEEVIGLVKQLKVAPRLVVIACDPNFETKKFLALKQAKAEALGVKMGTILLERATTTEEILTILKTEAEKADGVIIQLPLPVHINTNFVLASIPKDKDVDVFGYRGEVTEVLPPVVGAIAEIAKHHQLTWQDKKVAVFGLGRLVGAPAVLFARAYGARVSVITEETTDFADVVKEADIIILGVGKPNLLTSDLVKEGAVVFDAGASEDGGLLVGDASPEVASKAALLTPVPGGIGPMTVALLFRNLLKLCSRQ